MASTWLCYVDGVWVDSPVLHHNNEDTCPAQHNELCGFYPYREESGPEDRSLSVAPSGHTVWPPRVG